MAIYKPFSHPVHTGEAKLTLQLFLILSKSTVCSAVIYCYRLYQSNEASVNFTITTAKQLLGFALKDYLLYYLKRLNTQIDA